MLKPKEQNQFFVLTGGPGVGKTTLIKALEKEGYKVVPEIARALIIEQQKINGDALPWKNVEHYKTLMFDQSITSFDQTMGEEITFFDRGFIDTIAYARLIESEVSSKMKDYAKNWRYNQTVFILPPWKTIYKKDNERKQDWEEVLQTHQQMLDTYEQYGYQTVELPRTSIDERVSFVKEKVNSELF